MSTRSGFFRRLVWLRCAAAFIIGAVVTGISNPCDAGQSLAIDASPLGIEAKLGSMPWCVGEDIVIIREAPDKNSVAGIGLDLPEICPRQWHKIPPDVSARTDELVLADIRVGKIKLPWQIGRGLLARPICNKAIRWRASTICPNCMYAPLCYFVVSNHKLARQIAFCYSYLAVATSFECHLQSFEIDESPFRINQCSFGDFSCILCGFGAASNVPCLNIVYSSENGSKYHYEESRYTLNDVRPFWIVFGMIELTASAWFGMCFILRGAEVSALGNVRRGRWISGVGCVLLATPDIAVLWLLVLYWP